MFESINDNVALIAEQHWGIVSRLDGIDARFEGTGVRLDGIDGESDKIQTDVSNIKYDLKQKVSYEEFKKM